MCEVLDLDRSKGPRRPRYPRSAAPGETNPWIPVLATRSKQETRAAGSGIWRVSGRSKKILLLRKP